jgi:hypothetical protein
VDRGIYRTCLLGLGFAALTEKLTQFRYNLQRRTEGIGRYGLTPALEQAGIEKAVAARLDEARPDPASLGRLLS